MPVFSKDTIVANVVLSITLPYMPIDSKISEGQNQSSKAMVIICLIIAGELIFGLPYHVLRYFRPTMLEVFDLSNTNFGDAFAVYGITAFGYIRGLDQCHDRQADMQRQISLDILQFYVYCHS